MWEGGGGEEEGDGWWTGKEDMVSWGLGYG